MLKKVFVVVSALFVLAFALAACGPAATTATVPEVEPTVTTAAVAEEPVEQAPVETDPLAMYAPEAVGVAIVTAGSSTVFPLSERMKQRFEEEGFSGEITIDSIGSGGGYERFCVTGETDIANASRAIKDSEVEACRAIGREPIEIRVGTDTIDVRCPLIIL